MDGSRGLQMTLKIAVPNKGRLNERAVELLVKSGLNLGEDWGRRLYVTIPDEDIEIMFVRAQDIPEFVSSGSVDMGITGYDQVVESGYQLDCLLELDFGHCRLSVAVPEASGVKAAKDIPDGSRVATSFPNIARNFFDSIGKKVNIITVSGAAEIMPYMGVADVIVDLVSSGSTLKTNRLIEVERIVESQAIVVSKKDSRAKGLCDVVESIKSVMAAEDRKYLMADVPKDSLEKVQKLFPGMAGPTVMNIAGRDDMVAIHVVIDKNDVFKSVNELKRLGGKGILTLPIDRLVP